MRTQAVLVMALVAGVLGATEACSDNSPRVPRAAGPFSAHADRAGTQQDEFVLVSGVSSLRVVVADTGKNLVEASSPAGAALRPVVVTDPSQVRLELVSTGLNGPSEVDVQLSSSVLWQVTVDGGTTDASLDLRGGGVSGVDVVGGTTHLDLTVPAQVRFSGGAGTATIDGAARSGISGGTTVTPSGWVAATNKYDIELDAGVSSFVLDRS
jgi:hypothetical protein